MTEKHFQNALFSAILTSPDVEYLEICSILQINVCTTRVKQEAAHLSEESGLSLKPVDNLVVGVGKKLSRLTA